jgi:hypothetical protein
LPRPIGPLADAIARGNFSLLCVDTPTGQRHVLIERDAANSRVAMYIEN